MTYDPATYWRERGTTYEAKFDAPAYFEQEGALGNVLAGLEFGSVLEVGCGFGRVAALLPPEAAYTGIDLSPDLLASARLRRPGGEFVETSLADFRAAKRKWDLVIAVEMLMHVPPADLPAAVRKLDRLSARHIVTLDWTTPLPRMKTAAHNFLHDYEALLATGPFGRKREVRIVPVGLQAIHVVTKGS